MNAGEFRYDIKVLRPTTTTSETGAEVTTYATTSECRARMVYGKGFREVANDEIFYAKSIYFSVRDYIDVKNTDLIEYLDERYRIIAIEHRRDERVIELTTELINE